MSAKAECSSGKRGFGSPGAARKARRGLGNRIRVYLCPECHRYHITSEEYYASGPARGHGT